MSQKITNIRRVESGEGFDFRLIIDDISVVMLLNMTDGVNESKEFMISTIDLVTSTSVTCWS
jgi:hypothetical protein